MTEQAGAGRILTTHVGSLPRPTDLLEVMRAHGSGEPVEDDSRHKLLRQSVEDVVRAQVRIGIDIVSDGEFSKPSYATYVNERLSGFGGSFKSWTPADLTNAKDFARFLVETGQIVPSAGGSCCQGEIRALNDGGLVEDIDNFRAAVSETPPNGAFMTAASPGVIAIFQKNEYYPNEDAYIEAIAEAMRQEYEAIVEAGFVLQIDCPDLAMGRHILYVDESDDHFVRVVERNVEALNQAVRNIPAASIRMHVCWGNYEGPHDYDIPLRTVLSAIFRAKPAYLLLEGANPRHEHEWKVFEEFPLPDDKILIPGVIDSTSNYVEHPELIAQRLLRYANVVGRERIIAGSDCGFSTFQGYPNVFPAIVERKLASLVQGARLASKELW